MPQIGFETFIDDGRIDFPQVPIVFPAYRSDRLEPKLHLNDLLFQNHALYHAAHDACPSEDILVSWAFRGMEGMRSYGFFDRYSVERVNPHGIVTRFIRDLEKIHAKPDQLESRRKRGRAKAFESNTRKFRRMLNVTRELLRRGFSVEGIADKIGKSVRQVYRHMARLLELGETWESSTDNSVDKSTDMSFSPPTHMGSQSAIDDRLDEAYTVVSPRYYMKLAQWRGTITSLACPNAAWKWFLGGIHPSERAEADKMRSDALAWQRLLDADQERIQRVDAYLRERERHDTGHSERNERSEPIGSVAWNQDVFGAA